MSYSSGTLIFPRLLHRFPHPFCILSSVVFVEVGCLDVGWRARVWIVQETLNTRQDSRHIVCRTPPVLQDIQAEFACGVYVGVEHVADKLDRGWFIGVLFLEMHHEPEGAVFEGCICWADDDCVPSHDIVCYRRCGDSSWRIRLHTLEISHQTATGGSRHGG